MHDTGLYKSYFFDSISTSIENEYVNLISLQFHIKRFSKETFTNGEII